MTVTNGYCTAEQVLAEIGNATGSDRFTRVEAAIAAASRQIDGHTGRRFWQDSTVQVREFYPDDPQTVESRAGEVLDISTTTGLIVKLDDDDDGTFETTLTIDTHFILLPRNAADDSRPYTAIRIVDSSYYFPQWSSGRPGVQVTAKFGFAAVPDDVEKACIIQAVQLYKASDAVFGGLSFGDGSFLRVRAGLNPIAQALLDPYCLPRVG